MHIWQVSPGYHGRPYQRRFQASSGTTPATSPPRSMPVARPRPNARAAGMTAFEPTAGPRLQKKVLQLCSRAMRTFTGPCP